MLVNVVLACNQLSLFFAVKKWIQLTTEHKFLTAEDHLPTMNTQFVQHVGFRERNSPEPKKISKEFTQVLRSEPHFQDIDGAGHWRLVVNFGKGSQIRTKSSHSSSGGNNFNWDRTASVLRLPGVTTKTPATDRAVQSRRSRTIAKPEFFKNMIEIPHEWTNVVHQIQVPSSTLTKFC